MQETNVEYKFSKDDIDYLLKPKAIMDKAYQIYRYAEQGNTHFDINMDKLPAVAELVLEVTQKNYPSFEIPFHSRWGHFNSEKLNRVDEFNKNLIGFDANERGRRKLDLVITSVLLDAGAGDDWAFTDPVTGEVIARSEGLALASYHLFCEGYLSSDKNDPMRADAEALMNLKENTIAEVFQVTEKNPLVGLEGRTKLLNKLGEILLKKKSFFKDGRPGNLVDYFDGLMANDDQLMAEQVLLAILQGLGDIWPGRIQLGGKNLGDVWAYPPFKKGQSTHDLIPFHKLSQWLTYSMIEPLIEVGFNISQVEQLTGLAEYRNGGLFIDGEVLTLKDPENFKIAHSPDSELVIEWRALTLVMIDKVAEYIRNKLQKSEVDFPLPKVLEGGTWWAGRRLAKEKRAGGGPPLNINSDGTVF
jgi:hypothetical protein